MSRAIGPQALISEEWTLTWMANGQAPGRPLALSVGRMPSSISCRFNSRQARNHMNRSPPRSVTNQMATKAASGQPCHQPMPASTARAIG